MKMMWYRWGLGLLLAAGMSSGEALAGGKKGCDTCATPQADCTTCPSCGKPPLHKLLKQRAHEFDKEKLHPDHCWPDQYTRESIRRVNAPMAAQLIAGNRLESVIWEHYFDEKDPTQLTPGGMSRIQYLTRRKPYVIPNVELQSSFDSELDQQRITAVTAYAQSVSLEPLTWNVTLVNRGKPTGLFGLEGPKSIDKMIGVAGQPPRYEPQIKASFFESGGGEQ